MSYPCEWLASTDPNEERGTATFMVDGQRYVLGLDNFAAFQSVSKMLDVVFQQGKEFAAQAVRGHVEKALDKAEREHGLI